MSAKLYAPRGADLLINYVFPDAITLVDYTAEFKVYDARNGTALVTFGTTPSANSSEIQPVGNVLALVMKSADVDLLPVDASDETSPAILAFDLFITSPGGVTSKIHGGSFIVQPFGSGLSSNGNDVSISFEGQDIQIELESGTTFTETPTGAVRFDSNQSLTVEQKQTAQTNVGVYSAAQIDNLLDEITVNTSLTGTTTAAYFKQGTSPILTGSLSNATKTRTDWATVSTVVGNHIDDVGNMPITNFPGGNTAACVMNRAVTLNIPSSGSRPSGGYVILSAASASVVRSSAAHHPAVGVYAGAFMAQDEAQIWAINCTVNNLPNADNTGDGCDDINMYAIEADADVHPLAGGSAPTGNARAIYIGGGSTIQPLGEFTGVFIDAAGKFSSPQIQYKDAIKTNNGASETGLNLGTSEFLDGIGYDGNSTSQSIKFTSQSSSVTYISEVLTSNEGKFNFDSSTVGWRFRKRENSHVYYDFSDTAFTVTPLNETGTSASKKILIQGRNGSVSKVATIESDSSGRLILTPESAADIYIRDGSGNTKLVVNANGVSLLSLVNAANDSAAASFGVEVGYLYRNGSSIQIRVS